MAGTWNELRKLMGTTGSEPAGIGTVPSTVTYPGQLIPANQAGMRIPFNYTKPSPVLSDFDIELMAACISNKHPVIEGQSHCFCTLKRLERGISKD